MTDAELFASALTMLAESWATAAIPERVRAADYDRAIGERICRLMFEKCGGDSDAFRAALRDFIALSEEFVRLQIDLDKSGHYAYSSYDEVRAIVYDNPEVMDRRYLNGLFLSTAFWVNHTKILDYFHREFCDTASATGTLLEAPAGTGIFISEFARRNPGWTTEGIDISESAVGGAPMIDKKDVFALPEDRKFDRIICGELLEHLEKPVELLETLSRLLAPGGTIFLTTAVWAANIDHIYLYISAQEVRDMLETRFRIESEIVLNVRDGKGPEEPRTPINYACILTAR
jgi:SAM-dependent methyltransferase